MQVEIEHLSKTYSGNLVALRDIQLRIEPGLLGLLGPNGAGKTTLMRVLATLLPPTSGTARIGGYDTARPQDRRHIKRLLGYLPQELGLYPNLNAHEFLDYMAILKGLHEPGARDRRVDELLELVGLRESKRRKLREFSGGMKRRVGLAQALLTNPQLLIVDEPTAGLDPEERIRIRTMLSELALAERRVIILSTHIVEDVAQTCRRLVVLHKGRIRFDGTSEELAKRADGQTWQISTSGARPKHLVVTSILPHAGTIEYRVVGSPRPDDQAVATAPTVEDGYLSLMTTITD